MISKELFSEVLGVDICEYYEELGYIYYGWHIKGTCYEKEDDINIYELAHMCKEWATEKGYEIIETQFMIRAKRVGQEKWKIYEYPREMQDEGLYFNPSFTFKICQWILENKENN